MNPTTLILDDTAIGRLKRHVAPRLPEMSPSHSMEFAARGLGYRTYASLLSALREAPLLIDKYDLESSIAFAGLVEYDIDPDDVLAALSGFFDLDRRW